MSEIFILIIANIVLIILLFISFFAWLRSQKKEKESELMLKQLEYTVDQEKNQFNEKVTELKENKNKIEEKLEEKNKTILLLTEEKKAADVKNEFLETDSKSLKNENNELQKSVSITEKKILTVESENRFLKEKLENTLQEIDLLQKKFTETFENLASKIMEEKSSKFMQLNQDQMKQVLAPLREQLSIFKEKFESSEEKSRISHATLVEQIKSLQQSNKLIREEAVNLTKALKGDVKLQGNWGEIILERVLETSGLVKGREYVIQAKDMKLKTDEGNIRRPDVIIHLPENKHLIIDSKVSLVAYEKYCNSENDKEKYLHQFLVSVKAHIDNLHSKYYQNIKGLQTPDFVFLFLPIESTFSLLNHVDSHMIEFALKKQIVIVSPTTLLATLRTISYIWKQENQTKFAYEIARQSGKLYDSFVLLLDEIDKLGYNLDKSKGLYFQLLKRISSGKGNLVSRIENLKQLGARVNKQIPDSFLTDNPEIADSISNIDKN